MEFRMATDLSVMQPKELEFNFDELYKQLSEKVDKYRNVIVTEDGIAEAKKDRALLRKVADSINAEKIRIKKEWMAPCDEFEKKCKVLIGLCSAPAAEIDAQIKAFDEKKKVEKRAGLEAHFAANIGDAAEYVAFADVFDAKWLNATVALETAKLQIEETCARYKEDVEALKGMCEGADASTTYAIKRAYKSTRSIAHAIKVKNEIEQELRLQAERKASEAKKQKAEEELAVKQENPEIEESSRMCVLYARELTHGETSISGIEASDNNVEVCFRVRCSKEQLKALKVFLLENKIWYGRV